MVLAFERSCDVIIYKKTDESYYPVKYSNNDKTRNNLFRISFNVDFQRDANKNPSTISIYNLSKLTREQYLDEKDLSIELKAGYGIYKNTIFKGDVQYCEMEKTSSDYETKFICGDGYKSLKNVKINKSFDANTPFASMIESIKNEFIAAGTSIKDDIVNLFKGKTSFGELFTGKGIDILTALAKKQNLEILVLNNSIEITKKNEAINKKAIVLNKNTGLIGTPAKKEKGITLECLIIPENIFPNRLIQVESQNVNGFYTIETCSYSGDTHGSEWTITIEGKK